MTIKQFLSRHVEGYLFKDIRTMMRVKLRKGQRIGGVGYPTISSTLAGMEMLGGILQKTPFTSRNTSTAYFSNYWDNFFALVHPKYKHHKDAFWKLIRNGVSHTYLTKTGIWITRGNPSEHLKVVLDGTNYYLAVDIKEFFDDFVSSYNNRVRPLVYGGMISTLVSKIDMEQRVNEMITAYEAESNLELGKIPVLKSSPYPSFLAMISGASVSPSGTYVVSSGVALSGTIVKP